MLLASGLSAGKLLTLDSIISGIGREAGSRWRPAGERHSSVNVQYVIRDLFVSRALTKEPMKVGTKLDFTQRNDNEAPAPPIWRKKKHLQTF